MVMHDLNFATFNIRHFQTEYNVLFVGEECQGYYTNGIYGNLNVEIWKISVSSVMFVVRSEPTGDLLSLCTLGKQIPVLVL